MFENFVAEITLASPLIVSRLIVGDSLLAGIEGERHGDGDRAIRDLPIAHIEGVPQMSVMLPYTLATARTQKIPIIRSIMRDMMHDPDMAHLLDKPPGRSYLKMDSGPFSTLINFYPLTDLEKLYFVGRGDIDRIRVILENAPFIGSQRHKGFGQVAGVDIWPIDVENNFFGIVGWKNGRVIALRPIPLRLRPHFGNDVDFVLSNETWHNPYRRDLIGAEIEPCMTPPFVSGESFSIERGDLEDLAKPI